MSARQITQLEFSMINGKVEAVQARIKAKERSEAFLYLILEKLFPRSDEEISSLITDGSNDRGADAVHIRVDGGAAYIYILQSKYAGTVKKAGCNFPGGEVDKLISLISDIANRTDGLISTVNPVLGAKINDIWKLVDQGKTIYFRVLLASNSLPLVSLEHQRLSVFCKQYDMVSFEEMPFTAVAALLSSDNRPHEDGILDCIDVQKFERIDCDIRGLIANIDAVSYIRMITNDDQEVIKRHLFDENIRGYLGLEGGFNRQIQNSATSEDNHLFWYLNNGITIIAKDFSHQPVRGSKIKLTDFQIVNGAQTSYSLFNAFKSDPEKVGQLILLVKIFASSRDDISERIAIATNSQARIAPRDLKANDQIQKKISAAFEDSGILYERKKNQYEARTSQLKIDSLKLGQAIVAYELSEPHQAKTVSDEIFGDQYNRVFSEKLDATYLVRLAKLYMFVGAYADHIARIIEGLDLPITFLEAERAARAITAADRIIQQLPRIPEDQPDTPPENQTDDREPETTSLKPPRRRLRAFADKVMSKIGDIPDPDCFLEGERAGRCLLATDRMLSQLYDAPKGKTAFPRSPAFADDLDDEDDGDNAPNWRAEFMAKADRYTTGYARRCGIWPDGTAYVADAPEPDHPWTEADRATIALCLAPTSDPQQKERFPAILMLNRVNAVTRALARRDGRWPDYSPYAENDADYYSLSSRFDEQVLKRPLPAKEANSPPEQAEIPNIIGFPWWLVRKAPP